MRRFILLTLIGGLAAVTGHAVISFGLHPERLAPLAVLLQGCAALVVGAALFSTGLLGLAEGYEKLATQVDELLQRKQPPADGDGLRSHDDLLHNNQRFWRGYTLAGFGLLLFVAGLLVVTATMARATPAMFTVGVGASTVVLLVTAIAVCVGGLRRVRSAHVGVDSCARQLARLPDPVAEPSPAAARRRRAPRVSLFPRSSGRGLDQTSRSDLRRPTGSLT